MILTKSDLLRQNFTKSPQFPKKLLEMGENQYFVVYYQYDELTAKINGISLERITDQISLNIYRYKYANNVVNKIGFFKYPLETRNAELYILLSFYLKDDDVNLNMLKGFYKESAVQDYDRTKKLSDELIFKNSFDIVNRQSFIDALPKYVYLPPKVLECVVAIFDSVDCYQKSDSKLMPLYGFLLKKIVSLLGDGDGGVVREFSFSTIKYLFIGERSVLDLDGSTTLKDNLDRAKSLLRERVSINDIYTNTGWFFNNFDGKWRHLISDLDSKLVSFKEYGRVFAPKNTKAANMVSQAYSAMMNENWVACEKLIDNGWDVKLSDVLTHPTLYKYYPELFSLPIFYAHSNSLPRGKYFYNPKRRYIVIYGDYNTDNLHSILLHEIQHAIQRIEDYGSGGNSLFASIVTAAGGEKLREFLKSLKQTEFRMESEFMDGGVYSYTRYSSRFGTTLSEDIYYGSLTNIIFTLIQERNVAQVSSFLGNSSIENEIDTMRKIIKESREVDSTLLAQGFTDNEVNAIKFSAYELLLGEAESRNVQDMLNPFNSNELAYFIPLTTESLDTRRIVTHKNSIGEIVAMPKDFVGAYEYAYTNGGVLHLTKGNKVIPILHELGHIIFMNSGLFAQKSFAEIIAEQNTELSRNLLRQYDFQYEELFIDVMLSYFSKIGLDSLFSKIVVSNADVEPLLDINLITSNLDKIFKREEPKADYETLTKMNNYLEHLHKETSVI